jgi:hypothetical protein
MIGASLFPAQGDAHCARVGYSSTPDGSGRDFAAEQEA